MTDPAENNLLTNNYLQLLNLRLYTLIKLFPEENRVEAKDQMARMADPSLDETELVSESEILTCSEILSSLTREIDALRSNSAGNDALPQIEMLRERFDLNAEELILLTAVLAPALNGRFRTLYRLFGGSEEPRMDLLLSLLDEDALGRFVYADLLGAEGKLLSCGLIETVGNVPLPGPSTAFRPAPGLLSWLSGSPSTEVYQGRAEWIIPKLSESRETVPDDILISANAFDMAEFNADPVPMISYYGPDEERLIDYGAALGSEMSRPLLMLNLNEFEPADVLPLIRLALRDALLNRGILALRRIDKWIDSGGVFPASLGRMFDQWRVPVILLTSRPFVFSPNEFSEKRLILRIPVKGLTGSQRFGVWKKALEGKTLSATFDDEALRTLAGQFTLNTAQIRSAIHAGLGIAAAEDRDLDIKDLYEGARVSSMHHLSDLARKMETRYTLKDLVLPEKQAKEIDALISMARNRSLVLDDWGIGKKLVSGRGISALFTGVPGTGKTLSAQAIAGELGLDLYRVDLSTIVSKYIGETEKNLERVFTEAQNSNVILFFDEADSLFGRRSDVSDSHDRYANIEVGYLLQRIETYDGIVLMATNLGANLDEAFARRIHFIIDFPFPDEETRLRLWKLLLPENIEKEAEIDLTPFAYSYKIAGGGIRNAVVWAVYEAARNKRPLNRDDLLHGVEREYQKMGKVFIALR